MYASASFITFRLVHIFSSVLHTVVIYMVDQRAAKIASKNENTLCGIRRSLYHLSARLFIYLYF